MSTASGATAVSAINSAAAGIDSAWRRSASDMPSDAVEARGSAVGDTSGRYGLGRRRATLGRSGHAAVAASWEAATAEVSGRGQPFFAVSQSWTAPTSMRMLPAQVINA
jgi:hypothetical protein